MPKRKIVIFVGDGMADEPVPELDGRTPIQAASTLEFDEVIDPVDTRKWITTALQSIDLPPGSNRYVDPW